MPERINYEDELRKADAKLAKLQAEKLVRDAIREHEERESNKRTSQTTSMVKLIQDQARQLQALMAPQPSPQGWFAPVPAFGNVSVVPTPDVTHSQTVSEMTKRLGKGVEVFTTFSRYMLQSQVGEGGNSNVFSAVDENRQQVAIKFLKPDARLDRFKNEIRFCENATHPNIIHVIDRGVIELQEVRRPFLVMPLFKHSLRKRIKNGLLPKQAVSIFVGLLAGLKEAHGKGIIHRDIKPENILFAENSDVPVIADFGIAHFPPEIAATLVVTTADARMANRNYAAPEQLRPGATVGPSVDLFALGRILNEMFTGENPQAIGFRTIQEVNPSYAYLDELVENLFQQAPDRRLFPVDMADLFQRNKSTISRHLKNIFESGELDPDRVVAFFATTATDGKNYSVAYYNLDVIIGVGYRVHSLRGVQFRMWATQVLREYIVKGFALNDELLKNGGRGNYFDELPPHMGADASVFPGAGSRRGEGGANVCDGGFGGVGRARHGVDARRRGHFDGEVVPGVPQAGLVETLEEARGFVVGKLGLDAHDAAVAHLNQNGHRAAEPVRVGRHPRRVDDDAFRRRRDRGGGGDGLLRGNGGGVWGCRGWGGAT